MKNKLNEGKMTILRLLIVGLTNENGSYAKINDAVSETLNALNRRIGHECCKHENIIVAESADETLVQNTLEKTLLAHEEQILLVISPKKQFGLKQFTSKKGIRAFLPRKSELVATFYVRAIRRRRKAFFNAFVGSTLFSQRHRVIAQDTHYLFWANTLKAARKSSLNPLHTSHTLLTTALWMQLLTLTKKAKKK